MTMFMLSLKKSIKHNFIMLVVVGVYNILFALTVVFGITDP